MHEARISRYSERTDYLSRWLYIAIGLLAEAIIILVLHYAFPSTNAGISALWITLAGVIVAPCLIHNRT